MRPHFAYLYGLISYGAFLGSIVYMMGFLAGVGVPKAIDAGPPGAVLPAILVNLALVALFGVQHSVMARRRFKRWSARLVPEPLERSTFVLASSLCLGLLFWQWRPIPHVVWELGGAAATLTGALYWAGWALAVASTFVFSHTELFGLRQVHAHLRGEAPGPLEFRTPFLYRVVRHPMHAGMLVALWAAPQMTLGHLLFTVAMSVYVFVGVHFEERELVRAFGDRYEAYRAEVPALLPMPTRGGRGGTGRGSKWAIGLILALGSGAAWALAAGPSDSGSGFEEHSVRRDVVQVGPHLRSFDYLVPDPLPDGAPLLVVLHGSGGSGARIRSFVGKELERLARERGFVVAYPDGFEGHWNDCRAEAPFSAALQGIDDVGFLRAMVHRLHQDYGVGRVRVMGYSNGGHMGFRLALEASDAFQAVAAFGASLPVPEELDCTTAGPPSSVVLVNGTTDPINPYAGGDVVAPGGARLGQVRSAVASARELAALAGHVGEGQGRVVLTRGAQGGGWVEQVAWVRAGLPSVALYTVHGGGHTIPGPEIAIPERVGSAELGVNERRFRAVEAVLDFFQACVGEDLRC
jgi:methanethiol S-methyltransferase